MATEVKKRGIHRRIQIEVTESLRLRLEAGIKKGEPDECWPWTGAPRNGYGAIKHQGKVLGAHVAAYVVAKGEIPEGLLVTHECDNRLCCNPAHLVAGTNSKNVKDMVARRGAHFCYGERAANAVLNEELVRRIKSLHVPGIFGSRRIANLLGLKPSTVKSVIDGDTWKHVTQAIKGS